MMISIYVPLIYPNIHYSQDKVEKGFIYGIICNNKKRGKWVRRVFISAISLKLKQYYLKPIVKEAIMFQIPISARIFFIISLRCILYHSPDFLH